MKLQFNFNFHPGRELQAHQSFHSLGRGLHHVDQALMSAALELLAGILVLMSSTQDGDDLLLGGQGDGAGHGGAVALGGSAGGRRPSGGYGSFLSELPFGVFLLKYIRKLSPAFVRRAPFVHAFVRITPGHEKTGCADRPVFSVPGDIRRGTKRSAARFYGHTPHKLPRLASNLVHHRRMRLLRRPVIIQQHFRVCQGVIQKNFYNFVEYARTFFPPQALVVCSPSRHKRTTAIGIPPVQNKLPWGSVF